MAWNDTIHNITMNATNDLISTSFGAYTVTMGFWFYAIVMFFTMILIQIKLKNFGTTIITGILISGTAIPFLPTATFPIIAVMIALGITFILYKAFQTGRNG